MFTHRHDAELRALVRRDLLPRHQVGVMLVWRHDYLVALADVLLRPGVRHQVQRLGGVARPDYLLRVFRAYEARYLGASAFIELGRFLAERMNPAMDIGIGTFIVVNQSLNDLARLLGSGGVVQIDQGFAIDLPGQDREIFPDFPRVEHFE